METIKNTINQAGEKIQESTSAASKEGNKHVAKDGNAPLSTRATAAKDAVHDKVDERKHHTNADVHANKPT